MPAGNRTTKQISKAKRKQSGVVSKTSRMTREDFLVHELARVEEDVVGARDVQSYTALVALRKHASQLHAELIALRIAAAARDADALHPESLLTELRDVVADLPLDALAELEQAIRQRRGLRVVQ